MKLLYGITRTERGGAQSHLLTLLQEARERGPVELFAGDQDVLDGTDVLVAQAQALGVPVHLVPALVQPFSPKHDLRAVPALTALLLRIRPDLVHLHSSKAGLIGRIAARRLNIPSVFTAHGWAFTEGVPSPQKQMAAALERVVAPLTARIISVSDYDSAIARKLGVGRRGQGLTIHNGIPDVLVPLQPKSHRRVRVVMTARFSSQKAQDQLIRAAASVNDLEVWLLGDGPRQTEVQALAQQLGVQDRVLFLGVRSDVAEILAQVDVFALISNYEGFPISILEAMRAGLPVITSNVGGAGEAVMPGITGLLVEKGDVRGLTAALRRLSVNRAEREAMGQAGRARFLARFTAFSMVEKTWAVYQDIGLR